MKKIAKLFTLITASALLASCASPQYTWYKKGVSREEMRSYYRECEYNVGMNKMSQEKENRLMRACMEKAGFRWVAR
ncbi:hypothetical protein F480_06535 [Bibersteinia trehalosi Y31]|uniref:Lipoprotein n=1 Tax=Bibersteinia trehalosi Y31 TaxID=1261658 RepID=A0A179CYB8_BIBTR|nr:hypothetical protein [Bibersteinia trehalosi]OAQ14904.1 hypothetical protein F480_06535 [Bibersteinia trehalosi Y31]